MSEGNEAFDERYVRFREHADLRERVTELAGNQTQITDALRRIETMLTARPVTPAVPAPQETAAALALHRALDALDRNKGGTTNPVTLVLSWLGLLALGAGAAWVILH